MSDEPYPIVEVEPDWVLEPEALGSKEKFWYRHAEGEPEWLFKYPRSNTGEHWAEKIVAEVAERMHIPHAAVELAMFQGTAGSATLSFARRGRELAHGNQILAGNVLGYDPEWRFRNCDHTLSNIWRALEKVFQREDAVRGAKCRFGEYLVLDALVGNTDRHHENWGILQILGSLHLRERSRRLSGLDYLCVLAPSFDHASSLGRELSDSGSAKSREGLLASDRVGDYVEKARGGIYWSEDDRYGVSPLELVRRAAEEYPDLLKPGLERLRNLEPVILEEIIARMPNGSMTPTSQRFAQALMCYTLAELRKLL